MIVFEKCDSSKHPTLSCQSEQNINEWMESKYIFTYVNERKFVTHKFNDEHI